MSKIVEFAQAIEAEIEMTQAIAEHTMKEVDEIKEKNKQFKRRLIELLDEFYPEY
jgi:peptidoglycan hydrolase CwlO-like protein